MNKNVFILFICLFASIVPAFSQEEDENNFKKFNFGFNVGVSIPERAFARNDSVALPNYSGVLPVQYNQRDSGTINGYAKAGFHFNVYGRYMLIQNIGVMISIGGNFNSFDVSTLSSNAAAQYKGYGFSGTPPVFSASGSYYVGEYLFGFYFKVPLVSPNLSAEFNILFGDVMATYPTLTYTYTNMGVTASQAEKTNIGNGIGYNLAGGFKYTIANGKMALHLGAGYTGCSVSYPSYTVSTSGLSNTYNVPKSMSLGLLQFTIGGSIEI